MANAPVIVLEAVQAGFESPAGTAVAATRRVDFDAGKALLKRTITSINVPRAGSRAGTFQTYAGVEDVTIEVPFYVSTDDWPWWGNLFFQPLTVGAGASAAKLYAQAPPDLVTALGSNALTAAIQSATFEVGGLDTVNTWPTNFRVAGCVGETLDLQIRPNTAWTAKAVVRGMVTTNLATLTSLTNRAVAQYATGPQTKVFLDTTSSAFGTTQLVGRLVSADIKFNVKPQARHTLDGTTTAYRIALPDAYEVMATVTAEFSSLTELTAWTARTSQRLQLAYTGPLIAGASNHFIGLNLPGTWDTFDIVSDKGVFVATMKLQQIYDASFGAGFQSLTVNALTQLV